MFLEAQLKLSEIIIWIQNITILTGCETATISVTCHGGTKLGEASTQYKCSSCGSSVNAVNDKMLGFTYERRFESHADYPQLWAIRKAIGNKRGPPRKAKYSLVTDSA